MESFILGVEGLKDYVLRYYLERHHNRSTVNSLKNISFNLNYQILFLRKY